MWFESRQADKSIIYMKAYVTKYALTKGIIEVEARLGISDNGYDRYICFYEKASNAHGEWPVMYKVGTDAFLTKKEAIANAKKRRKKRIESLKKKIATLSKLTFK